jgi:cathepsin C
MSYLALVALLPFLGAADLPVHCLHHQVAGEWEFTLGQLSPLRNSCGHKNPDDPNTQPDKSIVSLGETKTKRFKLQDPDTTIDADGETGTWTMIYDEGFEVASGDFVYFAFSKFDFVADDKGNQNNVSHCDATQVGWYRNKARTKWGCYVAAQIPDGMPLPPDSVHPATTQAPTAKAPAKADLLATSSIITAAQPLVPTAAQQQQDVNQLIKEPSGYTAWVPSSAGYDQPMDSDWQKSVADALNFLQLGWTAHAYEQHTGKSPKELNRHAGVHRHLVRHPPGFGASAKAEDDAAPSFLAIRAHKQKVSMAAADEDSFDWRKKDGKNWLTPVVTQGDCGSCYTISTVHMLTSRNRIAKNDLTQPSFSVSFPLYCSEYNQGCDGGYGFLQSKWNEDVGLVPENCAPFSQGGGSCAISPTCNLGDHTRYRANNHHYVGGFYGGSSEQVIREELMSKGPIVVSFEPKEDFMYYKKGIYKSGAQPLHREWEQVDHAVLLIGYGAEKTHAHWTMQNSWGEDWGEQGYFRMARGIDESGCESIAVAAEVVEEPKNQVLDDFINAL